MLTAVTVVAVIAILLAILIPTISFFTNKFRIGVVEQINLGDSREQVLDLLGEPYDYKEGSSFFEYYSDNYRKLLEQNDSFDPDDIQDWDDFGDAFDEALELEQKLQTEEYRYIAVTFDSEGGVSSVFLDTARSEQNTGKKALKSYALLDSGIEVTLEGEEYATDHLSYVAEYADGSYYKGVTNGQAEELGHTRFHWTDRFGNECSYLAEALSYWFYDPQGKILYIYSDRAFDSDFPDDIVTIEISDGVTNIGEAAFSGCSSLMSIIIPDGITFIGDYAFNGCTSLTNVTIPDSVTSIGSGAFGNCPIESATMPTLAINFIPKSNLKTVVLTSGPSIKDYAFSNCDSLASVTIGNGVTSIGYRAFYGCQSLTSITIPDSVTSIGSYAFRNCDSLTSVYITDMASWCTIKFEDVAANPLWKAGNLYLNGELVTALVIPDDVTFIEDYVFYYYDSLTSVIISDSVTSIGEGAFSCCTSLTSVTIGNSIAFIGEGAFSSCTSLTSITIPDSVTSIGDSAFLNCDSLTSVIFENPNGWNAGGEAIPTADLANPATAAKYLTDDYRGYEWTRE